MNGLQKKVEEKEIQALVFFLCSVFAPLWGVGYVLPFLLVLVFILLKNFLQEETWRIFRAKKLAPVLIVFALFLLLVLFSSLYHAESKWGSTEGFWVVLSAFIFFVFGAFVGTLTGRKKLVFYLKLYFCLGSVLLILTTTYFKSFQGGVWGSMNDHTTAVLMVTGALCGIFLGDTRETSSIGVAAILLPFIVFAFYFSVKISSSDAAFLLLVGLFFFLSILVPGRHAFAVIWAFFLLIICTGIAFMVFGEPFNFKSLLSTQRLESFLSFRPQGWLASLSLIRENPWTGIGSGLYKQFYEVLLPLLPGKKVVLSHSHCLYLVYFVAHGVVAGIAFITLLALILRLVFNSLKDPELAPLGLMVAGIWFFALTYGLVELTPASREMVPLLWGTSGLLAGNSVRGKAECIGIKRLI
ncbi:O-antigen ligase family protein [Aminivibrio sp.]|uniref:O-antigen ligase family protein n=1 Tax=Aminivibrio sp. TaxID=1872489 RepID=UPI00345EE67B